MAPGGKRVTVGGDECHAVDHQAEAVAVGDWEFFAGLDVPELDGSIHTSRKEMPAVGTDCHADGRFLVTMKGTDLSTGLGIPELDRLVRTCRSEPTTLRTKGHAVKL